MYVLSELLAVIAELYTFHLFLNGIFFKRDRSIWVWGGAYGIFAIVLACLSFIENASYLRLFFCAVAFTCCAKLLFDAKTSQALYSSISFCCLYVLTDILTIAVFSFVGIDTTAIMSYGIARAVCITISHTLLLLLALVVLAVTKRKRSAITLPFLFALSPGCITGIVLGVYFCYTVQATGEDVPFTFLIAAIGLLYQNILIVFYAEQTQDSLRRQHQMELAEQHFTMQEQYYAQLREEQNDTRAMFHDINKYLQAMQALVDEANTEAAAQVLQEAQGLFQNLGNVVDVGNSIVSVIINEYKATAEECGIVFDFDISVPENLGITAIDAYVILGNTLDNAVEACCALPISERYIHLQMRTFKDILFYQVENPFSTEYLNREKGKNHGYGLQNVRRCVEKHRGDMTISHQDGKFSVSLRLNNGSSIEHQIHVG